MNPGVKSLPFQLPRPTLLGVRAHEIGSRLRALRRSRGLSQPKFAALAGVDPTQLARVERGKSEPSVAWLEKLAFGLGIGFLVEFVEVSVPEQVTVRDYTEFWEESVSSYLNSKQAQGIDKVIAARLRAVRHAHLEAEKDLPALVHRYRLALEEQASGARSPDATADHPRIDVPPKKPRSKR